MRNRFAGHCCKCLRFVPVGEGHPQKATGPIRAHIKWQVKCLDCVKADRLKELM